MAFLGIKIKPLRILGKLAKIASIPASFVNPALGAGLRAGGSVLDKGKRARLFGDVVGPAAGTFAGGMVGRGLFGKLGKIGGGRFGKGVGGLLKKTFTTAEGGLDLGKIGSVAGAGASLLGHRAASRAAGKASQSQTDLRNMLISRLLASPNYNFTEGP